MAITAASALALETTATAGTSFATSANLTCSANKLYLACVVNQTSGGGATPSGLTGGGQSTWTQVRTALVGTSERMTLYRALSTSPGAAAPLTATWAASQGSIGGIWCMEYGGVKTTGSNGADAVVQSASNNSVSATTLSVTLASFADATNNVAAGFFCNATTAAATAGSGFTILGNATGQSRRFTHEWKTGEDTSVDISGGSGRWLGIALEIAADTGLSLAPTGSEYTVASGTPTYSGAFNAFRGLVLVWP